MLQDIHQNYLSEVYTGHIDVTSFIDRYKHVKAETSKNI